MTMIGTERRRKRGKRVALKAISEPIYLSENLPREHSSRATRFPRFLGICTDRIVPAQALAWGRLTHETDQWLIEATRWQLAAMPATITRPCPAYQRLDQLMGGGGKVSSDATTPAAFNEWWRA